MRWGSVTGQKKREKKCNATHCAAFFSKLFARARKIVIIFFDELTCFEKKTFFELRFFANAFLSGVFRFPFFSPRDGPPVRLILFVLGGCFWCNFLQSWTATARTTGGLKHGGVHGGDPWLLTGKRILYSVTGGFQRQ